MFTNLFLDSATVVVDSLQQVVASVSHTENLSGVNNISKNVVAIVAIVSPFVFTLLALIFIVYYILKKEKIKSQERLKMIEKGMVPPVVETSKFPITFTNTSGKPLSIWIKLLVGFGAGLFFGMILERLGFSDPACYFSMIFTCIGAMMLFGDNIFHSSNKQKNNKIEDNSTDTIQEKPKIKTPTKD